MGVTGETGGFGVVTTLGTEAVGVGAGVCGGEIGDVGAGGAGNPLGGGVGVLPLGGLEVGTFGFHCAYSVILPEMFVILSPG